MLQDSCGDLQQTSRDDIITDNDDITSKIEEQSAVIALHPNYYCRYAKALSVDIYSVVLVMCQILKTNFDGLIDNFNCATIKFGFLILNCLVKIPAFYLLLKDTELLKYDM